MEPFPLVDPLLLHVDIVVEGLGVGVLRVAEEALVVGVAFGVGMGVFVAFSHHAPSVVLQSLQLLAVAH